MKGLTLKLSHKSLRIILLIKIKIKDICKNHSLFKWVEEKMRRNYQEEVNLLLMTEQEAQINLLSTIALVLAASSW
jgi:hypothetical protein